MFQGAITGINNSRANLLYSPNYAAQGNNSHNNPSNSEVDIRNSISFLSSYLQNERFQIDLNLYPTEEDVKDERSPPEVKENAKNPLFQFIRVHSDFCFNTFLIFLYFLIGVLVYQHLEHWSFTNTIYFITQTYTTVGYGNITPTSRTSRMFTILYIFVGIMLVFSVLTDTASWLMRYLRSQYKRPKKLSKFQLFTRHFLNAVFWMLIVIAIPLIAAAFFSYNEGWTYDESVYFSFITSTSVGYVDRALKKNSSIWFNCFYIVLSIVVTMIGLNKISSFKRHLERAELWQIMEEIELSYPLLEAIDKKTRSVSRAEYVLHMLQLEGKVSYESDLKRWYVRFKEFDLDKDGRLTAADVEAYQAGSRRVQSTRFKSSPVNESKSSRWSASLHQLMDVSSQFLAETREVILETLFVRQHPSRPTEIEMRPTDVEVINPTVSPMLKASALRQKVQHAISETIVEDDQTKDDGSRA